MPYNLPTALRGYTIDGVKVSLEEFIEINKAFDLLPIDSHNYKKGMPKSSGIDPLMKSNILDTAVDEDFEDFVMEEDKEN